jgi:hypothetical protein
MLRPERTVLKSRGNSGWPPASGNAHGSPFTAADSGDAGQLTGLDALPQRSTSRRRDARMARAAGVGAVLAGISGSAARAAAAQKRKCRVSRVDWWRIGRVSVSDRRAQRAAPLRAHRVHTSGANPLPTQSTSGSAGELPYHPHIQHSYVSTTSVYVQRIDVEEIMGMIHARRAPKLHASAGLELCDARVDLSSATRIVSFASL